MSCRIYLENGGGRFNTGDEITGRVDCYFNESTRLRNIKVRLKCKEHNQWAKCESYYDTTTNRTENRQVTYTGDNVILLKEQILYGTGASESLPQGRHSYPFRLVLPADLPSSFKGIYGSIIYTVKAIVDRPWRFNYTDSWTLDVKSPLYVDRFPPRCLAPATFEDDKTVCCLCCTGGNISMRATIARKVFVPGEAVTTNVKITNLSNSKVDKLRITLKKIVKFKVTSPSNSSRTSDIEIFKICERGVGAHGERNYNLRIPIPVNIEVPNFTRCKLFEVQYRLQIEACLGGCSSNLHINTYPYLAHIASQRASNIPTSTRGFNVSPTTNRRTTPPPPPPAYSSSTTVALSAHSDINPPSYNSLMPEKGIDPGGRPTAPTISISAPPLRSASNSRDASSLETPPPIYSDVFKNESINI